MQLPDVKQMYLGSTPAVEAYLGDVLVWPITPSTGCSSEGGIMSVSGVVEGGKYVIYGCGYVVVADNSSVMISASGETCDATILGDSIIISGGADPLVFTASMSGDTFRLATELSGETYYLWATSPYAEWYNGIILYSPAYPDLSPSLLFTIDEGSIQTPLYSGGSLFMYSQFNDNTTYVLAQTPEWVYDNLNMRRFRSWVKMYNYLNVPTGITLVNSIFPQGTYVQNRINLPFKTALGMEFDFEGEILANVGGICFGGIHIADNNDFRFFASTVCYYDVSNKRISISGANRGNIRKVHTYNYGLELTFADGTVRSTTGATLTEAPELDATIEIGRQKIKHFKATLGNNVVFEGFPAKRDSDGYVGLYDRITGQLYLPENQNYLTYD